MGPNGEAALERKALDEHQWTPKGLDGGLWATKGGNNTQGINHISNQKLRMDDLVGAEEHPAGAKPLLRNKKPTGLRGREQKPTGLRKLNFSSESKNRPGYAERRQKPTALRGATRVYAGLRGAAQGPYARPCWATLDYVGAGPVGLGPTRGAAKWDLSGERSNRPSACLGTGRAGPGHTRAPAWTTGPGPGPGPGTEPGPGPGPGPGRDQTQD